jgi:hypothetical protein
MIVNGQNQSSQAPPSSAASVHHRKLESGYKLVELCVELCVDVGLEWSW